MIINKSMNIAWNIREVNMSYIIIVKSKKNFQNIV